MLDIVDQHRLRKLLSDTIPLLCKRTLGYSLELSVEAFIGITLSADNASNEVITVSFKETIQADGHVSSYVWSEVPSSSSAILPPLVEPVAFNVLESESCDQRTSPTADSVDGNNDGLEKYGEYDPNLDDGRYCAEYNETEINSANGDPKRVVEASASSHLPFPVKIEEADIVDPEDRLEDFETDADFESTSHIGSHANPKPSVAHHHYSPAACRHNSMNSRQHHQNSAKFSKRSRQIINQPCSAQSLLTSTAGSKSRAKIKKTTFPALNTLKQPGLSECVVENGNGEPSWPHYTMLDGVHSPVLIAPTPMQAAPKKRCRVCYAAKKRREVRYCCGTCPERPGLCLEPCFREFHRSMISVTAPAFIFSGVEPDEGWKSLRPPDIGQVR